MTGQLATRMAPLAARSRVRADSSPTRRPDDPGLLRTGAATGLLALQRSVGNRAVVAAMAAGKNAVGSVAQRPVPSVALQRDPDTAVDQRSPEATDEAALVRRWSTETTNENALTDRVFYHRHPERVGQALVAGSAGAAEWIEIRNTVVRPALAIPKEAPGGDVTGPGSAAPDTASGTEPSGGPGVVNDPLGAAWDAGLDLLGWARDTGGEMIDAVSAWLGIGRAEVEAPPAHPQEQVVDVPIEPDIPAVDPAPAHQRGDAYKNQLANNRAGVKGSGSCSPTSFTMALIDLYGGDEEKVRSRTVELIKERGGNSAYEQTAELVIELLQIVDWDAAYAAKPEYFFATGTGDPWPVWTRKQREGKFYKDPYAQQYVAAQLYGAISGDKTEAYAGLFTREAWDPVIRALADGAVATAEGKFTSGHVVNVVDADDSGVTINDPYGLWLKGSGYQILNGSRAPTLSAEDRAIFDRRASQNERLAEALSSGAAYSAWGERNFLSWAEVAAVQLGTWVSVLRPR